jgi:hypothetical protein
MKELLYYNTKVFVLGLKGTTFQFPLLMFFVFYFCQGFT